MLAPSGTSLEGLLRLLSTLSKAHLGYLHCASAFLRWVFSSWRSLGLLQTVWALWERVWMTLKLAERWWWLAHCRYWSVWVGFSVHSDRQSPIHLWFYNGVQEGDGPILLVGLHSILDGRANTVYVLKEVLFMDFLVDDKGIMYIPVPKPGSWARGQYWEPFAQNTPCKS